MSAQKFILCLGGIETPRFMLNCKNQIPTGIGNSSDMVGRCFMEHLNVPMGSFLFRDTDNTAEMQFYTDDAFADENSIGKSNITFGIVKKLNPMEEPKR